MQEETWMPGMAPGMTRDRFAVRSEDRIAGVN